MSPDLPDALRLREVKYGAKSSPAAKSRAARQQLEAARYAEALDLFLLAEDEDGISEVREHAVADGRPVLLIMIERVGRTVPPEEWKRAGDAAAMAGRWRDAFRCYTLAADEAGLERVREQIPDYDVFIPKGK